MLIATVLLLNFLIAFYVVLGVPMKVCLSIFLCCRSFWDVPSVICPIEVVFLVGLVLEVVFLVGLVLEVVFV